MAMKYHYLSGVKKSFWERYRHIFWGAVAIFVLVLLYDMFVNNCSLFIKLMIWTWQ